MPRPLNTIRPRKPVDVVEVYPLTDDLSGKPRCHFRRDIAAELVEQGLACWCKSDKAVQLTEIAAEPFGTESAITHSECAANAGAARRDSIIAAACCKVKAWPLVGVDPAYGEPTRAPLPTEPGGVRAMSCEELTRVPVFHLYDPSARSLGPRPVKSTLRKSRTHLVNNYFVQQRYEDDDQESPEEEQERLRGVPAGCREGDVSELDT
jgi:hypothetical protein